MKSELCVIVPSRGRPQNAVALKKAFEATCTRPTHLLFCLDDDDPSTDEYRKALHPFGYDRMSIVVSWRESHGMCAALNKQARPYAQVYEFVGFMGDDHSPRTIGWDQRYIDALEQLGTGIVYGNDLVHGPGLPTQWAMTSDIVRSLGYMVPPALVHLWADNAILDWGNGADCLRYVPFVTIEHLHPIAGKAEWDETYVTANSHMLADQSRYFEYKASGQFDADVAKILELRRGLVFKPDVAWEFVC